MRRARLLVALLPIAALVVADQVLQFTALVDGEYGGRPIAPFDPPLFNDAQRATLERLRRTARDPASAPPTDVVFDAELGWRPADDDAFPARAGATRRLATFGCSFTHGDEVAPPEAWPAQLDDRVAAWDVVNFGVGGYGIDQALLRFRAAVRGDGEGGDGGAGGALAADEVWLGLLPRALLRIVSQYRPALRHQDGGVAFKPRFVLEPAPIGNGSDPVLVLVPNPARSLAELVAMVDDNAAFLGAVAGHDAFVDRAPVAYAPRGSHWTHRSALARLWLTRVEGRERDPAPWLADAESEVFALARAICRAFAADALRIGARFRVVLLADRWSLDHWVRHGGSDAPPYWQAFADRLAADGLDVVDLARPLLTAGALTDASLWMPQGHYAPRMNALVAERLAPLLAP